MTQEAVMADAPQDAPETGATDDASTATAEPETGTTNDGLPPEVREVLRKERKAAREAAKRAEEAERRVAEFEERDKTELERLEERASKAEAELERISADRLRLEVAFEKKLPAELAGRLQGASREELEADADALRELVVARGPGDGEGGAVAPVTPSAPAGSDPAAAHNEFLKQLFGGA